MLGQVLGLYGLGQYLAVSGHPVLAAISLGLGMQQAGWLAHDYIHGRDKHVLSAVVHTHSEPSLLTLRQAPTRLRFAADSWLVE